MDTETRNYLVNDESRTYIPMSTEDMQQCKQLFKKSLICFPQTEMYLENRENCESNLIFERNTGTILETCPFKYIRDSNFIKPLGKNSYYIYVKKMIPIRENCHGRTSDFSFLNKTGILTMNPNCEIILNGMKIFTKNTHKNDKIFDITPNQNLRKIQIKDMALLRANTQKIMGSQLKFVGYNEEFDRIINMTNDEAERLKTIENIDEFERGILIKNILILVAIIVLILLIKAIFKRLC